MLVQIKKLRDNAVIPQRQTACSAGFDLHAAINEPIEIPAQSVKKIGTGFALAFDNPNAFAGIFARSGLALKQGLRPANCVGVIDADYRNECIVALYNDSNETVTINPGERIAQLIFLPTLEIDFQEAEELDETERGLGGFGSTGLN